MWFRDMFFMSLSICFALMIITLTLMAIFLISFSRFSRFFGLRSFESVMPRSFNCGSCSFFRWTPATTNGPITGPRPASSIPRLFIGSFLGRVRYINVCSVRDYISFFKARWSSLECSLGSYDGINFACRLCYPKVDGSNPSLAILKLYIVV